MLKNFLISAATAGTMALAYAWCPKDPVKDLGLSDWCLVAWTVTDTIIDGVPHKKLTCPTPEHQSGAGSAGGWAGGP